MNLTTSATDKQQCVVTLVHGTFASGSPWTQEGSEFRSLLQEASTCRIVFRRFEWNGENGHHSRTQAGSSLASFLHEGVCLHPTATQFVVAHSHGGNVCLYALRDSTISAHISGIVCLSTPFLACRPRDLSDARRLFKCALGLAACLTGAAALWVIIMVLLSQASSPGVLSVVSDYGGLLFALAVICTLPIFFMGSRWAGRLWTRRFDPSLSARQRSIVNRIALPVVHDVPVMCFTSTHDEAGRWLHLLGSYANLPFALWKSGIVAMFAGYLFSLGLVITLWNSRPLGVYRPAILHDHLILTSGLSRVSTVCEAIATVTVSTFLQTIGFMALLQLAMAVLPRLLRGHPLGFGWESVAENWIISISAVDTPTQVENCGFRIYMPTIRRSLRGALHHTSIYSEPLVIADIARWIASVEVRARWIGTPRDGSRWSKPDGLSGALLLYRPRWWTAWIPRVLFFLSCILLVLVLAHLLFKPSDLDVQGVNGLFTVGLFALVFRAASVNLE